MNLTKLLLATLVGAIANFLAGWGLYAVLLKNITASGITEAAKTLMLPEDQQKIYFYFISGLFFSLMLAYIYERWAGIRTFQTGAVAGAVISIMMSLSLDFGFLASTNWYNGMSMLAVNAGAYALMGAITGGVIGWALGYNRN